MKKNLAKRKLMRGQPTIGTWLTLGHLHAARVLARMGFDWLTLDCEHVPYDWREVAAVVALIAEAGCVPLIRVPDGTHTWIKRALDAGAFGIVVPMVETVEQARSAIAAAKYPPIGNRSVGGGMHNLNFGCTTQDYFAHANDEILVVLQTESPQGLGHAREIYGLPGCDAVFIGLNDLRFQMRAPEGTFPTDEELEVSIQKSVEVARDLGTPSGMHVFSVAEANKRMEQGMQFIAVSSDLRMLSTGAKEIAAGLGLASQKEIARY